MSIRLALSVCAIAVALHACAKDTTPPTLDIATTTGVQNSGLLEALLPRFSTATIRVHAAGSGRALEMLSDRVVDLVISHAPETDGRDHIRNYRIQGRSFRAVATLVPGDDG